MKDFFKEILEIARDTAEGVFDRLDKLVDESDVVKKVKESGLMDVNDFFKNIKEDKSEDDVFEEVQQHYANPKNGFDTSIGQLRQTIDEQADEIVWLRDSNNDLMNHLDDYKLALQVLLDGEARKRFTLDYSKALRLSVPSIDVKVKSVDEFNIQLEITQDYD